MTAHFETSRNKLRHFRCPNGPEMDCLSRLSVDALYISELPPAVLRSCVDSEWVREDNHGFAHMTIEGRKIWQARR